MAFVATSVALPTEQHRPSVEGLGQWASFRLHRWPLPSRVKKCALTGSQALPFRCYEHQSCPSSGVRWHKSQGQTSPRLQVPLLPLPLSPARTRQLGACCPVQSHTPDAQVLIPVYQGKLRKATQYSHASLDSGVHSLDDFAIMGCHSVLTLCVPTYLSPVSRTSPSLLPEPPGVWSP